jgi:UrcA family protein
MTTLKWISSLTAATALSLLALSASAIEPVEVAGLSKKVKMWDLDLAKSEDVQTLYDRLRTAANDVCREEAQQHWKSTRRAVPAGWTDHCIDNAVEAAVRDVGNRGLAALHTSGATARL